MRKWHPIHIDSKHFMDIYYIYALYVCAVGPFRLKTKCERKNVRILLNIMWKREWYDFSSDAIHTRLKREIQCTLSCNKKETTKCDMINTWFCQQRIKE